jgi:hypothetical protein
MLNAAQGAGKKQNPGHWRTVRCKEFRRLFWQELPDYYAAA